MPILNNLFFSVVDIGSQSYWWDYGTLDSYYENNLKIAKNDLEGHIMRTFYGLKPDKNNSCLLDCQIKSGLIQNSVLIGVKADFVKATNCLMINVDAK